MNSSILHKNERWFRCFFFLFVLFVLASTVMNFIDKQSLIYTIFTSLTKVFLILSIVMNYIIITKTKEWRKNGREITQKLGLKRILLLETNLITRPQTKVYEIHHTPAPFKYGFTLRKQQRLDIMNQLKEELSGDFEKLNLWKNGTTDNLLLMTTTHSTMAHVWGKTGEKYFYMKEMEKSLDPYVKMNIWQWIAASFSTTGRFNLKTPKQWDSYYFYNTQIANKVEGEPDAK